MKKTIFIIYIMFLFSSCSVETILNGFIEGQKKEKEENDDALQYSPIPNLQKDMDNIKAPSKQAK